MLRGWDFRLKGDVELVGGVEKRPRSIVKDCKFPLFLFLSYKESIISRLFDITLRCNYWLSLENKLILGLHLVGVSPNVTAEFEFMRRGE